MQDDTPLRLVSLESRRSGELATMLGRAGFTVFEAPSMQEVPIGDQQDAKRFVQHLMDGDYDLLVLLTGVGFRKLLEVALDQHPRESVLYALSRRPIACRGPKPVAVLKELGIRPAVVAPEPNTYRELLNALSVFGSIDQQHVLVQEYGVRNRALAAALTDRGARVTSISIYAWAMPDDLEPLQRAVSQLCDGDADGLVLTSQQQLVHLFEMAEAAGRVEALYRALTSRCLVASVGPITTEALHAKGILADLEPQHPKMGHLVKVLREQAHAALAAKRAQHP